MTLNTRGRAWLQLLVGDDQKSSREGEEKNVMYVGPHFLASLGHYATCWLTPVVNGGLVCGWRRGRVRGGEEGERKGKFLKHLQEMNCLEKGKRYLNGGNAGEWRNGVTLVIFRNWARLTAKETNVLYDAVPQIFLSFRNERVTAIYFFLAFLYHIQI